MQKQPCRQINHTVTNHIFVQKARPDIKQKMTDRMGQISSEYKLHLFRHFT